MVQIFSSIAPFKSVEEYWPFNTGCLSHTTLILASWSSETWSLKGMLRKKSNYINGLLPSYQRTGAAWMCPSQRSYGRSLWKSWVVKKRKPRREVSWILLLISLFCGLLGERRLRARWRKRPWATKQHGLEAQTGFLLLSEAQEPEHPLHHHPHAKVGVRHGPKWEICDPE